MTGSESEVGLLSSITRGASLYFLGKITVDALGFLLHLILSRTLGAGLYGVFAYGNIILNIALVFTTFGSDQALLKYLPQYENEPERQKFVLGLALMTSLIGGLLTAGGLYLLAPMISRWTLNHPDFVAVLRLFALILVFDTVAKVVHATFRSVERLEYEIASNKVVRPSLRFLAVLAALGIGLSLVGIIAALLVASALALGLAFYFLFTKFELLPAGHTKGDTEFIRAFYNFSAPLTLRGVGNVVIKRTDVLMVGFFLSSRAVGIYNVSVLVAGLLTLPLSGFNQLFPPIASRLYSNGNIDRLNSLYVTVTRWTFTICLVLAVGALIYRIELLQIFGEEYAAGETVLLMFVVGQLFNCIGGANGYLLMMTNHQYVLVVNQWSFAVLNVVLNYIFILEYGFIGAAIATAGILAALNLVKTLELWYLEGLIPYSLSFIKPLSAGVVAAAAMYTTGFFIENLWLLLVGGVIGGGSYVTTLFILGLEEEDKEFIKEVLNGRT